MMLPTPDESIYLNDLEFVSEEHRLDADQTIAFASQFDPQSFHLDPERAQDTFFRGLAASGWHTMAITIAAHVESVPWKGHHRCGRGDLVAPPDASGRCASRQERGAGNPPLTIEAWPGDRAAPLTDPQPG